jgi:dipeptidyl aminopeptidase/acylaminoacyl peptidase
VVPPQSIELVDRLTAAHDEARLIMVQGAGHGFEQAGSSPIVPDIVTLTSDVASFFLAELAQPG